MMTDEEKKQAVVAHLQERLGRLIAVAIAQIEKGEMRNLTAIRCLLEADEQGIHLGKPSQFIVELNIDPNEFIPDDRCVQVVTQTNNNKVPYSISHN